MRLAVEPVEIRTAAKVETIRDVLKTRLPSLIWLRFGFTNTPINGRVFERGCQIVPASVGRRSSPRVLDLDFIPDDQGTVLRGAFRLSTENLVTILLLMVVVLGFWISLILGRGGAAFAIGFISSLVALFGQALSIVRSRGLDGSEREVIGFLYDVRARAEASDGKPPTGGIVIRPRRSQIDR